MRHRNGHRKLNRTSAHRKALLKNLTCSLLEHETIVTTLAKAKELRKFIEPLITIARQPTVANRRLVFDRIRNRAMVVKLFDVIGPRYLSRPGGFTSILKNGYRNGDAAPLAFMRLISDN